MQIGRFSRVPLRMIAIFDPTGRIQPFRFKLENEKHEVEIVTVKDVRSRQERKMGGTPEILFLCTADQDGRERLFELVYGIASHRWFLTGILT